LLINNVQNVQNCHPLALYLPDLPLLNFQHPTVLALPDGISAQKGEAGKAAECGSEKDTGGERRFSNPLINPPDY